MAERLEQTLKRVRDGDQAAVAVLVERFAGMAHRLAMGLVGDTHLAEEMVQEAFMVALTRLDDLKTPDAFPGWFRQIIRTHAYRHLRRRGKLSGELGPEPVATQPSPLERMERAEMRDQVRKALAQLKPAGREATELFYLHGFTIHEVAAQLQVPVGTVKRRLHDARARLRSLLIALADEQGQ